jgi:hypothetical protein
MTPLLLLLKLINVSLEYIIASEWIDEKYALFVIADETYAMYSSHQSATALNFKAELTEH